MDGIIRDQGGFSAASGSGLQSSSHMRGNHINPFVSNKSAPTVDVASGAVSLNVPIFTSPGRSGFGPDLSLAYGSSSRNGVFGLGWSLATLSVTRKTSNRLPQYLSSNGEDVDVYVLSGTDDLVPTPRAEEQHRKDGWRVRRYNPRVVSRTIRIEKWTKEGGSDENMHWRVISGDNITSIFGRTDESRVFEPPNDANGKRKRVFGWLLSEVYDSRGNLMQYSYKKEDGAGIRPCGMIYETNRLAEHRSYLQKYLKRIKYGNRVPNRNLRDWAVDSSLIPIDGWLFEVVFDYGDHDKLAPTSIETQPWSLRKEPFSSHRSGFEIRTYRLCHRILNFHHMPEKLDGMSDVLVSSTTFEYDERCLPGGAPLLLQITEHGHRPGLAAESLPSIRFEYTQSEKDLSLCVPQEANCPDVAYVASGLTAGNAEWLDLDGEGTLGCLTKQGGAWWYQRNESPATSGEEQIPCHFSHPRLLKKMPNISPRGVIFTDLNSNGMTDAVCETGSGSFCYYERTSEGKGEGGWSEALSLSSVPVDVDMLHVDDQTWMVDLTGDGSADVLRFNIDQAGSGAWYPSLAAEGFGSRICLSIPDAQTIFLGRHDPQSYVYMADMTGDGLADLVQVRNGSIMYWPNQGYGRFGHRVIMENSPRVAGFTHERLRLADVSGSGSTDLVYLPPGGGAWVFYNRAGNRWSGAKTIDAFPMLDKVATVHVIDLLGQGTACICWFSPHSASLATGHGGSLRYIDLMGGRNKPGMLRSYCNGLGLEISYTYAPSTKFYLKDERAGHPWATRLAFPVQCVETVTMRDFIMDTSATTKYAYHDGYYDSTEREFRGFGMVEQWIHEIFSTEESAIGKFEKPLVLSKSWFHLGRFPQPNPQKHSLGAMQLPAPAIDRITADATRSLKGSLLCEEMYLAEDLKESNPPASPYYRKEHTYWVETLQPRERSVHNKGVYRVIPRETLTSRPERGGKGDAVLNHDIILEVDDHGHATKQASIAYGKEASALDSPQDKVKQEKTILLYTEVDYTNIVDREDNFLIPLPCETRKYHLTSKEYGLLKFPILVADDCAFFREAPEVVFENADDTRSIMNREKVLVDKIRAFYRSGDLSSRLPLGKLEAHSVADQSFQLAMTPGLISKTIAQVMIAGESASFMATLGGYCDLDNDCNWWIPSTKLRYAVSQERELLEARKSFYTPMIQIDQFDHKTHIKIDDYFLHPISQVDPLGNTFNVEYDYFALTIKKSIDANGNERQSVVDALRRVIGTTVEGKPGQRDVSDSLDGFPRQLSSDQLSSFLQNPQDHNNNAALLAKAGRRIIYQTPVVLPDGSLLPAFTATLCRDHHGNDLSKIDVEITYHNGSGKAVQISTLVEDGQKWQIKGRNLYDGTGNVVRAFRSAFAPSHAFLPCDWLKQSDIDLTIFLDPLGRAIGALHADHTWIKSCYLAWSTESYSAGDSILVEDPAKDQDLGPCFKSVDSCCYMPSWYAMAIKNADPRMRAAASKSESYNGTPTITHKNAAAQVILMVEDSGSRRKHSTRFCYNARGDVAQVTNARGVVVTTAVHDMCSRQLYRRDADSGEAWTFVDCLGRPLMVWDALRRRRLKHDALGRLEEVWISGHAPGLDENLVTKFEFGESAPDAVQRNLRTMPFRRYDQAGMVQNDEYDFKGNCTKSHRRLAEDYRNILDWSKAGDDKPKLEDAVFSHNAKFNARNQAYEVTTPDGSQTHRSYSFNGNLCGVAFLSGQSSITQSSLPNHIPIITDIKYTFDDNREKIEYGNNVVMTKTFDQATRQLRRGQIFRQGSSRSEFSKERGKMLQDMTYTYDCDGRMVDNSDAAAKDMFFRGNVVKATQSFTYDALGRLIGARGREQFNASSGNKRLTPYTPVDSYGRLPGDGSQMAEYVESYVYDEAGNILSLRHEAAKDTSLSGWTRTYHYEFGDKLTRTAVRDVSEDYEYDALGCMTSAAPYYTALDWDFNRRLRFSSTQVVKPGNTPEKTWYVYDASGRRVRKVTDRCISSSGSSMATKLKETIYLETYQIGRSFYGDGVTIKSEKTICVVEDDAGSENPIVLIERDSKPLPHSKSATKKPLLQRYQLTDALELDDQGQVVSYAEYSPFGSNTFNALGSSIEANRRYRFAAYERDQETGLYHCGERYYAPWLGRWTSPDPIGIGDGLNRYSYVQNDPVGFQDRKGTAKDDKDKPSTSTEHAGATSSSSQKPLSLREQELASLQTELKDFQWPTDKARIPAARKRKLQLTAQVSKLAKMTDDEYSPPKGTEIVEVNSTTKVYARFQVKRPDQVDIKEARVSHAAWDHDTKRVTYAFTHFDTPQEQLWLNYDRNALAYTGYYHDPNMLGMTSQHNLKNDDAAVSFILPSGVEKLTRIEVNREDSVVKSQPNAPTSLIFGIKGTLDPAQDYAYTTGADLAAAVKKFKGKDYTGPLEVLAERQPRKGEETTKVLIRMKL